MMSANARTNFSIAARVARRRLVLGAGAIAVLSWASPTPAKGAKLSKAKAACLATYKSALQLESASRLQQARETLGTCMKASCGAVRQKCAARYAQLEGDIPSIIAIVKDDAGARRSDVRVTIDGQPLATQLDGRAVPVDPGMHTFSFATDQGVFATTKIMIMQGEHNRAIEVAMRSSDQRGAKSTTMTAVDRREEGSESADSPVERKKATTKAAMVSLNEDEPPSSTEARGGSSMAPYLLGGVGVLGLGAFGMFTYWAKKDNNALSECSPNCSPASTEHIRKLYLVADISAGLGIAALGAATIVALSSGSSKEKQPAPAYAIDVKTTRSGAFATVSGSF